LDLINDWSNPVLILLSHWVITIGGLVKAFSIWGSPSYHPRGSGRGSSGLQPLKAEYCKPL